MVVNTWDGAANTNWDDAGNWNSTGITDRIPTASDNVIIPDTSAINNPTLRQNQPCASFDMQANATVVGAGFKITVHEEDSNVAVDNDAIISGDLDLEIQTDGATTLDLAGTSGNFRDVIINHANCVATLLSATTIDRNLTITAGQLNTDASSNYALTVTGDVNIASGATLTGNASAISMNCLINSGTYNATSGTTTITGEESGGFAWQEVGTFNHNNGTVDFNPAPTTHIQESNFYNLTITASSDGQEITLRDSANNLITVFGNLTVARGRLMSLTTTDEIIIHGNTHVAAIGTCWHDADQATDKITHHGLVTNLGIYKINDGTTVNMNGGIRQLGTLTID